jgi:3-oxoacyl-[acyl-carrier protein] reductase
MLAAGPPAAALQLHCMMLHFHHDATTCCLAMASTASAMGALGRTLEHLHPSRHTHSGPTTMQCSGGSSSSSSSRRSSSGGGSGSGSVRAAAAAGSGGLMDGRHYAVEPLTTDLTGLVALVTGGARGLGSAIALNLASAGAAVVVHYSSSAEAAAALVQRISDSGGRAHALQADLSNTHECKALVHQANAVLGKVDILVSNAGEGNATPISQTTDEEWDRVMNINVRATMALMRELLPQMRARRFGRVITISSIVGVYGTRGGENAGGGATYAAAKAALIAFTKGIAHEGSPFITANVVVPGPTNPEPRESRDDDPVVAEDGSVRWLGMKYLSGRMGVARGYRERHCLLCVESGT